MTSDSGNGHVPAGTNGADASDEAALDALDAEPLDPAEAAEGEAVAGDAVDETLDERVAAVIDDLGGVERTRDGDAHPVRGRRARVRDARRRAARDRARRHRREGSAAHAGHRRPRAAGTGWIAFSPATVDRYALDRAEAWIRLAHRLASGR